MKLKLQMCWAILRGKSVCYRMNISPRGVVAASVPGFIVQNRIEAGSS